MTPRRRLIALGAMVVLAASARIAGPGSPFAGPPATGQPSIPPSSVVQSDPVPRIAIAYDLSVHGAAFNEQASEGAQRAGGGFDAEFKEITAKPDDTNTDREASLKELADAGYHPIFVIGSAYADAVAKIAPDYPSTWFGTIDDGSVDAPNVVGILFHDEQGSFLVGAAAALTSKTGNVGFLGAVQDPRFQRYEAGFTAGARAADPNVKVQVAYLSHPPDDTGSTDPAKARTAALGMYDAGADVIFAAAGSSGDAVIQAAHDRGLWAIGVDSDQYQTADPSVRGAILTSMLKRADVATYTVVMEVANGVAKDGNNVFGVGPGAVGYSTSGGFVDPIKSQLDVFAARIASGEILVPTKPKADATPAP